MKAIQFVLLLVSNCVQEIDPLCVVDSLQKKVWIGQTTPGEQAIH